MSDNPIQFACPACGKLLSIGGNFAGRKAKCPGCANVVQVPLGPSSSAPVLSPINDAGLPPAPPPGYLPPVPSSSYGNFSQGVPTNQYGSSNPATPSTPPTRPPALPRKKSSTGASVAGFFLASLVGFICSIVWIIIIVVTQHEIGIMAWGVGGVVGFVGGFIARNASPVYGGLMAMVAIVSIAFVKLVLIAGIMIMHAGANFVGALLPESPEQERDRHVLIDQMLADNQLQGEKKKFASDFNNGYFGDDQETVKGTLELGEDGEPNVESIKEAVKWSSGYMKFKEETDALLAASSDQEKLDRLEKARARHPNWIENRHHYHAILVQMLDEPDALSAELKAHAEFELHDLRGDIDYEKWYKYQNDLPEGQFLERSNKLNELAAERLRKLAPEKVDEAVNKAIELLPDFKPDHDAFLANLENMHRNHELPAELNDSAREIIENELDLNYDFEPSGTEEELNKRSLELKKLVNKRLAGQSKEEREQLISQVRVRHPAWIKMDLETFRKEREKAMKNIPGDGTFAGSFVQVVRWIDVLWLFFGASTAFGTAVRLGKEES